MTKQETTLHFTNSPNFHIDKVYITWLEELKSRYKKAQIKSAIKVNSEQLFFNWQLERYLVLRRADLYLSQGEPSPTSPQNKADRRRK